MLGLGTRGTRCRALLPALLVALAASVLGARDALARECHATCQESRVTCVDAAKVDKRGCKQQCRDAANPSACRRECRQGFAASKTSCKGTVVTCREECERPCDDPGDEECVDACVHELRECVAGVRDTGKACARVCLGGHATAEHGRRGGDDDDRHGGSGGDDCWHAADPLQCWLDRLGGVGKCLEACASDIEVGLDTCTTAASACREACTRPPGSASRAFIVPPDGLLE